MEDGEQRKNLEVNPSRQYVTNIFNVSTFLQSFWIRCGSVFSDIMDRKFIESKSRFVWYCGGILWIVYLLSQII